MDSMNSFFLTETSVEKKYHLTFDIDWAPDSCVLEVADLLKKYSVKGTFFVTHRSHTLNYLIDEGHEIGIHPNFQKNSSHGKEPREIIEKLLEIVPNARALRSHSLHQSSKLFDEIFSCYPQLKFDFSTFNYAFPIARKFVHHYPNIDVIKFNYNWEDDVAFYDPLFKWNTLSSLQSENILNFHPIHIYLNSKNSKPYEMIKKLWKNNLKTSKLEELNEWYNNEDGAKTFLKMILNSNFRNLTFEELICE